ncbi:hypothetical protein IWQ60_012003 [Tieghemiomyces parasiticus]|uniref:Uncharacterized protein n=1 Tax=Tieghemiomyces parasiticus TaxID=78921 RepID=A0A9W7ZLU2_9FUNG|nr:hypothetical protein IWQ60_012003 [Tieghemiomyces parasiticus]
MTHFLKRKHAGEELTSRKRLLDEMAFSTSGFVSSASLQTSSTPMMHSAPAAGMQPPPSDGEAMEIDPMASTANSTNVNALRSAARYGQLGGNNHCVNGQRRPGGEQQRPYRTWSSCMFESGSEIYF